MNGARSAGCCVVLAVCLLSRAPAEALPRGEAAGADESAGSGSISYCFEPIRGLKVNYSNNELIVRYSPYNASSRAVQVSGRSGDKIQKDENKQKQGNVMKRIGSFMMMIPIGMQLMSVPMQLASVKMTLLRSILVAKVALFMLLLRVLFAAQKPPEKIVVVRNPPKEVHEHFYHPFEDTKHAGESNWLDHPPPWME